MLFKGPFERYLDRDLLLKDKYDLIRRMKESYKHDIEISSICINPFPRTKIIMNHGLRKWLCWVNKNIILNLGLDYEVTTLVKLRIAASMLNKVDSLTDLENVQIFTNLKDNIYSEIYVLNTEELPF